LEYPGRGGGSAAQRRLGGSAAARRLSGAATAGER
jgi:hypothetical protein